MCGQCGCEQEPILEEAPRQILSLHQNVQQNNRLAEQNRTLFRHLLSLNLLSSPGSGKITLIQRLLQDFPSLQRI